MKRGILCGLPVEIHRDGSCTAANWFSLLVLDFLVGVLGIKAPTIEYGEGEYWQAVQYWLFHRNKE